MMMAVVGPIPGMERRISYSKILCRNGITKAFFVASSVEIVGP